MKQWFFGICLSLLASPLAAVVTIPDEAKVPILSPSFAERKIGKLLLSNGIEVYCVSDPQIKDSAASLTVRVGSWSDPEEFPGLAHFCEHMLFLGTEKYPIESEYRQFMRKHNGTANAYTAPDHTAYLFSIDTEAFPEALDRFSQFFKEPLFHPSGVAREIRAIDQEFAKNIENDSVRQYYVSKLFSHPEHPHQGFAIGNQKTLAPVTREVFLKWYGDHYSANLMHLSVYSSLPLEELQELVVRNFQIIRNTHRKPLETPSLLYDPDRAPSLIYLEPIKRIRRLTLFWEMPFAYQEKSARDALELLCFLLGHEGKESLLAQYKEQRWAEGLRCGPFHPGGKHLLFSIQIDLTKEGVLHRRQIIEQVYSALQYLNRHPVPDHVMDEFAKMRRFRYMYPEQEDAFQVVMEYAGLLLHEDLRTFPEKSRLPDPIDQEVFSRLLKACQPHRGMYMMMIPSEDVGINYDQREPWIQIPFATETIQEELLENWEDPSSLPGFGYPPPNPFIPSNFPLITSSSTQDPYPKASLLVQNERGKLYFAEDQKFLLPQVFCTLELQNPLLEKGDRFREVLTDLYLHLLQESLSPLLYQAKLAGLDALFERSDEGIRFHLSGIQEKVPLFLESFFSSLLQCSWPEEDFIAALDFLQMQYANSMRDTPLRQAMEMLQNILVKSCCSMKEKAEFLQRVSYKHFRHFAASLSQGMNLTGILYGRLTSSEALEIWNRMAGHFQEKPQQSFLHTAFFPRKRTRAEPNAAAPDSIESSQVEVSSRQKKQAHWPRPVKKKDRQKKEIIVLPASQGPYFLEMKTENQGNATVLAIEWLPFSFQRRAVQQIFSQAVSEPFFSHLRTKQQTGYLVSNRADDLERHLFTYFAVQSNSHDPRDLLSRFELLLEQFLQEMEHDGFAQADFEKVRSSLLRQLEHPPKNMEETMAWLRLMIFSYDGDFAWIQKRADALQNLTYQDFLQSAREMYGKGNKRRFAILSKGKIPELGTLGYQKIYRPQELRSMSTFSDRRQEWEQ